MKRPMRAFLLFAIIGCFASFSAQAQAILPAAVGGFLISVCSTTNYDLVVSKALGIAPADLRSVLVSGQSLDEIAANKTDTLNKVLLDAHLGEVGQALSAGLISQDQARQIINQITSRYSPGNTQFRFPIADVNAYNFQAVKAIQVAAGVMNAKCPDLVKAMANGHSLVAIVSENGGQIGTVLDAMLKAYQDALSQDVQDHLITQTQAKGLQVLFSEWLTVLVNQAGPAALVQFSNPPAILPGSGYSIQGFPVPDQNNGSPWNTQPNRVTPTPSNTKTPTPVATPSL